jgi:hypothetical protein
MRRTEEKNEGEEEHNQAVLELPPTDAGGYTGRHGEAN